MNTQNIITFNKNMVRKTTLISLSKGFMLIMQKLLEWSIFLICFQISLLRFEKNTFLLHFPHTSLWIILELQYTNTNDPLKTVIFKLEIEKKMLEDVWYSCLKNNVMDLIRKKFILIPFQSDDDLYSHWFCSP